MAFEQLEIIIIIAIMVMILAAIIIGVLSWMNDSGSDMSLKNYKYQKKSFMTQNEIAVLRSLYKMSSQHNYLIFTKVRMLDLIEPSKGMSGSDRKAAEHQIGWECADFVLCDSSTFQPALILRLADNADDRTHSSRDRAWRQKIDAFMADAYASADLPVLYIRNTRDLEEEIRFLLRLPVKAPESQRTLSESPPSQDAPS
ncbi:MAG: DUF2726 domain-containing protein [Oscillospiraceae bacterium]|nr:DUF2726 domain-containing protein [Oscillospiraceae bacterium]